MADETAEEQPVAELPTLQISAKVAIAWTCDCGSPGILDDVKAVQPVIFGARLGLKCRNCKHPIQLGLNNTLVVPVTDNAQPVNRAERRLIESVRRHA